MKLKAYSIVYTVDGAPVTKGVRPCVLLIAFSLADAKRVIAEKHNVLVGAIRPYRTVVIEHGTPEWAEEIDDDIITREPVTGATD